ncbi:selenium metabolism-associated LysR family transcriptional regulator [Bariatricus massiliensis]|uniref:LysR family transcriptional regulator n=1 Tax=Bariatricus massiliensis TaxID=1745713 RepID=A0ABS8DG62_9FIRM|nr:selenium metabolism-associated LysR family transcriptional regulator [Bariatricus massiliensis]MCB7304287.1 LysR family transcriptional regulator [Bariatricus massiliensis]MCB7374938.1 LysR family transcriptional regulator [Bariatricus massiliensis]MCB7387397.1 LysR family transcriptional regulator [Bariatricus massiliensis]MCB7411559.1 LysR family transcriptional regulator [Bariatricus massiliensis]MCQ5253694.1 selenium metabolism-associated LysR family transcriptional regulator [Bariatric
MNLKQLEAFVYVADGGSFSKAARELYLTQPTVSAHISSLEKELNVRLFVRNTKEVNLSEDGRLLYEYAKQMIELEEKIVDVFLENGKKDVKCITIAASTIPAQYILPEILARFSRQYPGEQFKMLEADSQQVVDKVASHMVEIGFTGTVLDKKHCKYVPFYQDELVVLMPNTERYQKILSQENSLLWMTEEPIIMREEGSGTRKEAEKLLKNCGLTVDGLNVVASMESTEAIKKSVKTGIGITVISKLAALEEIKAGSVLEFPMPSENKSRNLNLVYNKNFQLSPSAQRFLKLVRDMYGAPVR